MRGLRVGVDARGRSYVHAGAGGVYYRQNLSSSTTSLHSTPLNGWTVLAWMTLIVGLFGALAIQTDGGPGLGCGAAAIVLAGVFWAARRAEERRTEKRLEAEREEQARRTAAWEEAYELVQRLVAEGAGDVLPRITELRSTHGFRFEDFGDLGVAAVARAVLDASDAGELHSRVARSRSAFLEASQTFNVRPEDRRATAIAAFQLICWHALADHDLSQAEDDLLIDVLLGLTLTQLDIPSEVSAIEQFRALRGLTPENLPVIATSLKLQRHEVLHHETTGAAMEKRVIRTWVENGERQKDEDLVPERTGDIYVTSKRVLVVADGTLSIPYDKILDVEIHIDEGHLSITKDGRKTPYLLTCTDLIYTAGIIQMANAR